MVQAALEQQGPSSSVVKQTRTWITFTPPDTPLEQIAWLTVQSTLTGGLPLNPHFPDESSFW